MYLSMGMDGAVVKQQEGERFGFLFSIAIEIQHTYLFHFCVSRSPRYSQPLCLHISFIKTFALFAIIQSRRLKDS
jgi:hypothetical protein